jgi:plasmid segregation protein ParM
MGEKRLLEINLEVGNDNGNSEHDLVINGKVIQQPNVMAKIRKLPMIDEINPEYVAQNIHDNLLVTVASPSAAPGIYFIGNYALNSGERIRNIEVGVDNNKLNSEVIIVNTLAQIAGFVVNQVHSQKEDLASIEILVKADMTTALPVTQYTKSAANEFANKFLKDNHTVIVHVGTLNVNVNIIFEYVKVLPESVPATFELQHMAIIKKADKELTDVEKHHNEDVRELFAELNQDNKIGTIDGRYFVQKRILHVSIGEGTTEYPLTKHIEFDPNFIRGSNNGIGHAIDKALDEFKQETNLLNYSRQKYSAVLKDRSHKYSEAALDIVSGYIEEESEEILHHIKTEIQRANNEVDIIVVYGGGSILMKEHLKSKIETVSSKADIKLFYVPEKFAVTLEAKGMYEFTTSKIYKALKSKYLSVNK